MTRSIPDDLLVQFSELLATGMGLSFPRERWRDLERGIAAAAPELDCPDARACVERLLRSPLSTQQIEILARHLTVHETYFFREPQSFELLRERILPDLIRTRRNRGQRLRLWSAGCATGEEAYSLAMTLIALLPDVANWNITVLATDINPRVLQRAAEGVYSAWSFRSMPAWIKDRYFKKTQNGRFAISADVRRLVTFAYHNLARDDYPSLWNNTNAMDVIFCRNVLMYFAPARAHGVLRGLCHALIEGGWLVVGMSEAALVAVDELLPVYLRNAILYQKDSAEEHKAAQQPGRWIVPASAETKMPRPAVEPVVKPVVAPTPAPTGAAPLAEAEALYRQGRYAEAHHILTKLLPYGRENSKVVALLIRASANQGDLADALAWCDKALATDKLNSELHYLRATVLQEQGADTEAARSLKRTLYLAPRFVLAHFALGNLALRAGRSREAAKHFANALALADQCHPDEILPDSDGLTAGRLTQIIRSTTGKEIHHADRCDPR